MTADLPRMHALDTSLPIWDQFFAVAPLVVIGTPEGAGYDLAPKHMVTPLGQDNFFGFVCTPRHSTYHNLKRAGFFTVSFPKPDQVVLASLAASPRCGDSAEGTKAVLQSLPTRRMEGARGVYLDNSYLLLDCDHVTTIDGFGQHSLIGGAVVRAWVDPDYLRASEADEQELLSRAPLLAYLAPGRFSEIRDSFAFPFPKDFKN